MFINPQTYFVFLFLAIALYWALPARYVQARAVILIAISAVTVGLASPFALPLCILSTVSAFYGGKLLARNLNGYLFSALLLIQAAILFSSNWLPALNPDWDLAGIVGLAYFTIKSMGFLFDIYNRRVVPHSLTEITLLNLFFPTYSAGPIERVKKFSIEQLQSVSFDLNVFFFALLRIALGLFKLIFVAKHLLTPFIAGTFNSSVAGFNEMSALGALFFILLKWLALYIGFSGYSDIAVGSGQLFGIKVMENFKLPFLAANIQNFWQRWHLSLSNFISNDIYYTMVRKSGLISLSLIAAFILVGLWHELTWNYLIWGLIHGTALAIFRKYDRALKKHPKFNGIRYSVPFSLVSRFLTISLVAWVSAFANSKDLTEAWALTKALLSL